MGRPERPVDPEAGPVQAFAVELRQLRQSAGKPKYLAMAQRTGRSQTSLSDAAGGKSLPTWETVEAFVRACDGDVTPWRSRWEATAAAIKPELATGEIPPLEPPISPAVSRLYRPGRITLLTTAAAVIVLAVTAWLLWPEHRAAQPANVSATPKQAIPDGADPKKSRCSYGSGVKDLDTAEVDLNGFPAGTIELRYAPACRMVWPRFTPFAESDIAKHTLVHVSVDRRSDSKDLPYDAYYVGEAIYGGMLDNTSSCVSASVRLGTTGKRVSTRCFQGTQLK